MITPKIVKHEVGVGTSHSGLYSICILKALTDNADDSSPSICSTPCCTYVISPQVGPNNIKKIYEKFRFAPNEADFMAGRRPVFFYPVHLVFLFNI